MEVNAFDRGILGVVEFYFCHAFWVANSNVSSSAGKLRFSLWSGVIFLCRSLSLYSNSFHFLIIIISALSLRTWDYQSI